MTPQEKAQELIAKFKPYMYCYMGSGMLTNDYDEGTTIAFAKKCSLIMVDEILERSKVPRKDDYYNIENKFWQDVKEALNK